MHLHEVILDGRAGDDHRQLYWDLPQALRQLRARVLDLVPLHKSSIRATSEQKVKRAISATQTHYNSIILIAGERQDIAQPPAWHGHR